MKIEIFNRRIDNDYRAENLLSWLLIKAVSLKSNTILRKFLIH